MAGPGRDQRGPMERLVRIAIVLHQSGDVGVPGQRLIEIGKFEGASPGDLLLRDIRALNAQGWQIDNIAGSGEPARYRMRSVDNRLRVRLTTPQLTALRRAVLVADRDDLVDRLGLAGGEVPSSAGVAVPTASYDDRLDTVLRAVRLGAVLRFGYKGTSRVVHPESMRSQNGTWYLRGQEDPDTDGVVKAFVVRRMEGVSADDPGTARRVEPPRHVGLHPMSWHIDDPIEVTLRTPTQFDPDVRRWLQEPEDSVVDGDDTVLTYRITNRAALRARLFELGRRVRIEGPEEIRSEVIADLERRADL